MPPSEMVREGNVLLAPDGVDKLLPHSPGAAFRRIDLHRLEIGLAAFAGRKRQGAFDRLPPPDRPVRPEDVYVGYIRSMTEDR